MTVVAVSWTFSGNAEIVFDRGDTEDAEKGFRADVVERPKVTKDA